MPRDRAQQRLERGGRVVADRDEREVVVAASRRHRRRAGYRPRQAQRRGVPSGPIHTLRRHGARPLDDSGDHPAGRAGSRLPARRPRCRAGVHRSCARCGPTPPIYTAVYDEEGTEGRFSDRTVHSSFLQRLRPSARTFRALLPLYPAAIESFDLSGYDLVVSSSSAWAHAILCDEHTVHVSYCHNPFRYAWNDRDQTLGRGAQPDRPHLPAGHVPALAPVGLDRGPADQPLRGQLADDAGADQGVLRPRGVDRLSRRSSPPASPRARSATTT